MQAGGGPCPAAHLNVLTPRSYSERVRNMVEGRSLLSAGRAVSQRAQVSWGSMGQGPTHDPALGRWPPPFHSRTFNSRKPRLPPCHFPSLPSISHAPHTLVTMANVLGNAFENKVGIRGKHRGGSAQAPADARPPADARVCPPAPVAASQGACPGRNAASITSVQVEG